MTIRPEEFFRSMASQWDGWEGTKEWSDIEQRTLLAASSDLTGHIKIAVTLNGPLYDNHLKCIVQFEAGQLESIAKSVYLLFAGRAP